MVVWVSDGDTIKLMQAHNEVKVRLYGIDCPDEGLGERKESEMTTKESPSTICLARIEGLRITPH